MKKYLTVLFILSLGQATAYACPEGFDSLPVIECSREELTSTLQLCKKETKIKNKEGKTKLVTKYALIESSFGDETDYSKNNSKVQFEQKGEKYSIHGKNLLNEDFSLEVDNSLNGTNKDSLSTFINSKLLEVEKLDCKVW
jgi:hypothetical protein